MEMVTLFRKFSKPHKVIKKKSEFLRFKLLSEVSIYLKFLHMCNYFPVLQFLK
jgi:hypothetical protein